MVQNLLFPAQLLGVVAEVNMIRARGWEWGLPRDLRLARGGHEVILRLSEIKVERVFDTRLLGKACANLPFHS